MLYAKDGTKYMIREMNQYLAQFDSEVAAAIDAELARERDGLAP